MKITKIKKQNDKYYELIIENKKYIVLSDVLLKLNILSAKEITQEDYQNIIKYNNYYLVYNKMLNFISFKIRSEKECLNKMKALGLSNKEVNEMLNQFKSLGYIDDDKYLESYVNDALKTTLKGPLKIIDDLCALGISKEMAEKCLSKIDDNIWQEKASKIIQKKLKTLKNESVKLFKVKLEKHLLSLGYTQKEYCESLNKVSFCEDDIYQKLYNKTYERLSKKYSGQVLEYKVKSYMASKGF